MNSTDGIALQGGDTVLGQVREHGDRYVASLALVVDPQARPVAHDRPGPPPGGFEGPPPMPPMPAPVGAQRTKALVPGKR